MEITLECSRDCVSVQCGHWVKVRHPIRYARFGSETGVAARLLIAHSGPERLRAAAVQVGPAPLQKTLQRSGESSRGTGGGYLTQVYGVG